MLATTARRQLFRLQTRVLEAAAATCATYKMAAKEGRMIGINDSSSGLANTKGDLQSFRIRIQRVRLEVYKINTYTTGKLATVLTIIRGAILSHDHWCEMRSMIGYRSSVTIWI